MKVANLFAAYALTVLLLFTAGCGMGKDTASDSSSAGSQTGGAVAYKDGEYSVSAPAYDDQGYMATVKVVIKDGAVYSVDCDAESREDGTKKSHSENGQYGMKSGGAKHEWHEEIALFEKYVVENGVSAVSTDGEGKTDVITGCTIKVADYVDLINEALEKAKK